MNRTPGDIPPTFCNQAHFQNVVEVTFSDLHDLQALQYLNLAINNITKVQNLQRCESLARLDLTMNFVSKANLCTVASLAANMDFTELHLVGNPCTEWKGYRPYVIVSVPQLKRLVSMHISMAFNECILS